MSRKQDQRLVNAYERIVKGEPPRLDEAKEITKSRGKWFSTRLRDMKGSIKDLEGAIKKQSPNDVAASLSGIESQLTVMKQAINEAEKSGYFEDIGKLEMEIAALAKNVRKVYAKGKAFKHLNDAVKSLQQAKTSIPANEQELNEMGMVIGTPLSRRKDATPTDEAMNPKDKTGEREGYYLDTVNRGVRLMEYGVLSKAEYKKVKDFMKKTITF